MKSCRALMFVPALVLSCLAQAADYTIKLNPEQNNLTVRVKISGKSNFFRMPAWVPGDYELFNYGRQVRNFQFYQNGTPVPAIAKDVNSWEVRAGADEVVMTIQPSRGNFSDNIIYRPGAAFVFGPGAFGWFDGHQEEGCRVRFEHDVPVHCTLKKSGEWFSAPHYWELLDSPFVVGTGVKVTTRNVGSAKHDFVAFGNIDGLDIEPFGNMVQKIAAAGLEFFGKLPYEHYIFFGDFGGFAAGLEHANSNRIGYWTTNVNGTRGIMFHEYFHAFNVKRVRPKSLINPDFTKVPAIDSLWWLEGVTDYYASVLELRAGLNSQESFLASMGNGSQILIGKEVSLRDSSRRVWESRGSQGFNFSYYAGGRWAGFVFDTAIRVESQNKYSLDNVMLDLYKECGDTKGYDEARIRELIVKYGGEKMGPLYDGLINSPGGVDVSNWMKRAGLILNGRRLSADPEASETAVNTRKLLGYSLQVKL